MGPRRRRAAGLFALGLVGALTAGCVADPPPAQVMGEDDHGLDTIRPSAGGISLLVDRLDEGLNPHLVADQGSDTDLVASLTLPSAFRRGADGGYVPDPSLVESAEVVSERPFTVRYTLRPEAQWSDGVPVGAEDFSYLWRQMRSQPGVVDPEGYQHVVDVRSGAGGKVVEVHFDAAYPRWRTLFADLLPAHLFKDALSEFARTMRKGTEVSAGPYMVRKADLGRGVMELTRNDRFWDAPPKLDQILVRLVTGPAALGQALRAGEATVSAVADTATARTVAETVPGYHLGTARTTGQLELAFDVGGPSGADAPLRRALAAAIRPEVVGAIVSGSDQVSTTAFPFPSGTSVATTVGRPDQVAELLGEAGATRVGGGWVRDGQSVSLRIGVVAGDADALTAANTIADQLHAQGVGGAVWQLDGTALFGDALPHGLVDATVTRQRTDGDPVTAALSRYGCPVATSDDGSPARTATTETSLAPPPVEDRTQPTGTTPTPTPTSPAGAGGTRRRDRVVPARGSDLAGVCEDRLQRTLEEAAVAGDPNPALRRAGALVAEAALRVPLVRPRLLVARGSGVEVPEPAGDDEGAPFDTTLYATSPRWSRN